jgi:hypothetical protein
VELRRDGQLQAHCQGRYLAIEECGARADVTQPKPGKPIRKDSNAGGRSNWMDGFFNRPSPPLWKCVGD